MKIKASSFKRLWNYLNIYFLKPFDAVNDTITSELLLDLKWKNNYLEIGSGDGAFSFIMHGGKFSLKYDRYIDVDLSKNDIFNSKKLKSIECSNKNIKYFPNHGIDAREFHVNKMKKINFYKIPTHSSYEKLPLQTNSYNYAFLYTPHGLNSYSKTIDELSRVLKKGANLNILVFLDNVKENFLCDSFAKKTKGKLKIFFQELDNGRFKEIANLSKSISEWKFFFKNRNFLISKYRTGLDQIAWRIYDIQTRPILKYLIKIFNYLPINLRTLIKIFWMVLIYPILCLVFFRYNGISSKYKKRNCYIAFELKKI